MLMSITNRQDIGGILVVEDIGGILVEYWWYFQILNLFFWEILSLVILGTYKG